MLIEKYVFFLWRHKSWKIEIEPAPYELSFVHSYNKIR